MPGDNTTTVTPWGQEFFDIGGLDAG